MCENQFHAENRCNKINPHNYLALSCPCTGVKQKKKEIFFNDYLKIIFKPLIKKRCFVSI